MKTQTIAGVEFTFTRQSNPRNDGKHWQVSLSKTGAILQCFPGKTLEDKIRSINDAARICGAERFRRDLETI